MNLEDSQRPGGTQDSPDIDLLELARSVWDRKRLVTVIATFFLILGLIYVHTATFKYSAYLQVTPVPSAATGGFGAGLGGLRGLASLAGITMPGAADALSFNLYMESFKSRGLAEDLAKHPEIMQKIFASEWDSTNKTWRKPQASPFRKFVKTLLGMPSSLWMPPGGARLQDYLQVVLKVERDPKTSIVTIRMEHADPAFALKLLSLAHEAADERLRAKALARANENIAYLTEKLSATSITEHRMALAQALSEQEKMRMMTNSTTPFVAEPFGNPVVSLRPSTPRPIRDLFLAVIGGTLFGSFIAVVLGLRAKHSAS